MLPVIRAAAFWMEIPRQMRIPGGRLNLRVTEQLADHREALAERQRPRSIRVPAGHEFARPQGRHARGCGAKGAGGR